MDENNQGSSSEDITLDELFDSFCKVGDRTSDEIALRNVDKWFKQANLFTGDLTTTDTAIIFAKIAKQKRKLTKEEFLEMINELAEEKQMEAVKIQEKLKSAGRPSFSGVTKPIRGSVVADNMERLTNPTLYTGTHRHRFDAEGKGKGLAGRYEIADEDGYVQGYKNKGKSGSQIDVAEGKEKQGEEKPKQSEEKPKQNEKKQKDEEKKE